MPSVRPAHRSHQRKSSNISLPSVSAPLCLQRLCQHMLATLHKLHPLPQLQQLAWTQKTLNLQITQSHHHLLKFLQAGCHFWQKLMPGGLNEEPSRAFLPQRFKPKIINLLHNHHFHHLLRPFLHHMLRHYRLLHHLHHRYQM